MVRFTKGHGTANDFVVVPDPDGDLDLTDAAVAAICDRRTGVGGDGVLRIVLTAAVPGYAGLAGQARWFMDYRNADGGTAEMCGNGVRVVARYLVEHGYASGPAVPIATRDGVKQVTAVADGFAVDMGAPAFDPPPGVPDGATYVSMGNPHVVLFTAAVEAAPVTADGPRISAGVPGGTNVEYAAVRAPDELVMRVWERGVGETRSCGTGACAVAVAAAVTGRAGRSAYVEVPGGRLHVAWRADGQVILTGPAVLVADGEIDERWLRSARE